MTPSRKPKLPIDPFLAWIDGALAESRKEEKAWAKQGDYGLAQWEKCRWLNLLITKRKYEEFFFPATPRRKRP